MWPVTLCYYLQLFPIILYPRFPLMISSVRVSPSELSFRIFVFPIRATCIAYPTLLHVLALTSGEEYILGISLLFNFAALPVTSISSVST